MPMAAKRLAGGPTAAARSGAGRNWPAARAWVAYGQVGMSRVLVVDSDEADARALRRLLVESAMSVTVCQRGDEAMPALSACGPDLVILELDLPGRSGFDLCREIAAATTIPVLVVTGRTEEIDKVLALELGARDYVTKPFSQAEMLARVRAALRWSGAGQPGAGAANLGLAFPGLDPDAREVTIAGRVIPLPRREYEVLELLARNPGRVVVRERLMALWQDGPTRTSNTLEVHIKRLRQRIEEDPAAPRRLQTVRGVGYRFVP